MSDDARPSRRYMLLALVLLAVGSMGWKGYRFGGSNQSLQVPLLKHLADPSLYAHDPVLASFEGYPSYFFHFVAPLTRAVGQVEPVYFILYVLGHLAALAAVFFLGRYLFESDAVGLVACFLYIGAVPSLGAEYTYWPRLTHAHAATALLLWALYLHLAGRTRLAFALCGIAFDIHALYATHVVALIALDAGWRRQERGGRALMLDGLTFVLLASPALVWVLGRHDPVAGADWPRWLEMMRDRSAPHTFPFTVPPWVFARYLLVLALAALALAHAPLTGRRRPVAVFAIAVVLLCAAGVVFAEIVPVRRVIEAQLLRSTKWLTVFALLWVARLLVVSWEWGALARVAAVWVFAGLVLQQPAWMLLGLALYVVVPGRRFPLSALAFAGVALVAAAGTGAAPVPERLGLQNLMLAVTAVVDRPGVIACLVAFVLMRAAAGEPGWRGRIVPTAAAVAALVFALPVLYRTTSAALADEPWNSVQHWVRENTPRDAVVLTPPTREGFRVFSERAIVGEWKDGTQQFFSWRFAQGWAARMADAGGNGVGDAGVYDGFGPDRLRELGRRYGAAYVVVAADRTMELDRVYENEEFAVYRLPPADAAASR
jgi:hypothetical protein